jgi:hypothetical protein
MYTTFYALNRVWLRLGPAEGWVDTLKRGGIRTCMLGCG